MAKFDVEITQTVYRWVTIQVEADDEEDAKEAALDEVWRPGGDIDWRSKVAESSTYVTRPREIDATD